MNVPLSMIGKSVAQVYLGQAADLAHQGYHQLRRFYLKTALRLFLVGIIPIGLISLIGPWLFIIVFGESWKQAGVYIQLLFFASIGKFVVNPISQTLIILERQFIQLIWDVGRLSAVIISFGVPMFLNWPDTYAIGLYSITSLVAYVALFFMSIYALNQNQALTELKAEKKSGNIAVSNSVGSI
jgi:O-antigen/teichoic acid export membrane protein